MKSEIEKTEFRRSVRGYNPDDVDEYIESLLNDIESLKEEEAELYRRLDKSEKALENYRKEDKSRGDIIDDANKQAKAIIDEAKNKAAREILRARSQCNRIVADMASQIEQQKRAYDEIKKEIENFRLNLFAKYREHIKQINSFAETAGILENETMSEAELDEYIKLAKDDMAVDEDVSPAEEDSASGKEQSEYEAQITLTEDNSAPEEEAQPAKESQAPSDIAGGDGDSAYDSGDDGEREEDISEDGADGETFEAAGEDKAFEDDEDDSDEFYGDGPVGIDVESTFENSPELPPEREKNDARVNSYGFSIGNTSADPDDDSDEFYSDEDSEEDGISVPRELMDVLQVQPSKQPEPKGKRWKVKKSMSLTDEFDAVKYEDDE